MRVGSWNVRTLHQEESYKKLLREMTNYKVEILRAMDAIWTDSGRRILSPGHTIFYSGHRADNLSRGGVAGIVTGKVDKTILEWTPANDRLMKIRFNSKVAKLTIITCYVPTEEAVQQEMDELYEQLEEIRNTPRHDVLIVTGYINAIVGEDNTGRDRSMGQQGFGCPDNNGERLSDLCVESKLVIGGTLFMYLDIHKTTWRSPDQRTVSQIDQVIINQKWRRSHLDVKANRGADIGSDHVPVVVSVLKTTKDNTSRRKTTAIRHRNDK